MIEHPQITRTIQTGYPENMIAQPEHSGTDAMDDEILVGDSIVIDEERGEIILESNLEDYLIERLGFRFKTAE